MYEALWPSNAQCTKPLPLKVFLSFFFFKSNFNDILQATDTEPKLNFRTNYLATVNEKKKKEKKKCPTQHFSSLR